MIRCTRAKHAPDVFSDEECRDERAKACRIFKAPRRYAAEITEFEFTAYARAERKMEVRGLVFGKCAYCESRYAPTSKGDVEHFRPKGAITRDGKAFRDRGYYWLGVEWSNLLPSCGACNSRQEQPMAEGKARQMVGKGNEFPLADERRRAKRPGHERRERPLLLDPFRTRDVARYFIFDDNGQVRAAAGRYARAASTSIRIYGLQRLELVREREKLAARVMYQLDLLDEAYGDWQDGNWRPGDCRRLAREWTELMKFEQESAEYAGQARQLIARHIAPAVRRQIETAVAAFQAAPSQSSAAASSVRQRLLGGRRPRR